MNNNHRDQRLRSAAHALIIILLAQSAIAQVNEINFDDAPDNTVVDSRYAGVTFVNPLGGSIFARSGGSFAPSSPNVVSVFSASASSLPFFDAAYGAVDAHFSTPQMQVSIDARPVGPVEFLGSLTKRPFLEAYAAGGVFLGKVLYAGALPTDCCWSVGPTERLTFTSSSANIAYVRFSSQYSTGSLRTYAIFDNLRFSTPAVVTVAATDAVAGEPGTGQGAGTFTFSRSSTAGSLSVNFTVTGTATSGGDYTALTIPVTFASGAATATRTVSVIDDASVEPDETVTVTLASGPGYVVGSPASATVTIKSDDVAPSSGVIVDNAAASGVTFSGTWTTSASTPGYWASNYRHDGNTSKGSKSVTFTPNLPTTGTYEVSIWYPSRSDYAGNVPVDIVHAGVTTTASVSQKVNGGKWNSLGRFSFNAGTGGFVRIRTTGTSGYVVADAVRFAPVTEVIVDNAAASGVTFSGTWTTSTSTPGYWASNYRHDGNTSKGSKSVRFTPNLPTTGSYQVFAWFPARSDYASNVPVDIMHAGVNTTVQVNQRLNGGRWNLLGTFNFNAGTGGYAQVRNTGTTGYVVADAFKWVSAPAPSPMPIPQSPATESNAPALSIAQDPDGNVILQWPTLPGLSYTLQSATNSGSHWEPVLEVVGDGSIQSFAVNPQAQSASFRLMTSPEK